MPFDAIGYGRMLDEVLAPARGVTAAQPAATRQGRAMSAPPLDGGLGDLSGRAAPTLDGSSVEPIGGTAAPTAKKAPGAEKIEAKPPFEIQYKKGALDGAKTINDVVDAMKPASQNKYMDWWESKYGSIQDKWTAMQKDLGKRPDPNADLTRKEQFQMLMEFGMHLMRAAGQGDAAPGSTALGQAYGGARARQAQGVADYDQQAALIAKGRKDDLDSIGTYGEALKGQSDIDQNEVQMQEARARTADLEGKAPDVQYADDGMMQWDSTKRSYTPLTIDGKRQTNLKVGARGASAASRDSRTANQKNIADLVDRGVPEQLAVDIVYKRIKDPRKAYEQLYRDRRRQYASEAEARQETEDVIGMLYGADWKQETSAPAIQKNDPLGLRR